MKNQTQITDEDITSAITSQGFVATDELAAAIAVKLKSSLTGDLVFRTYNKLRIERKKADKVTKDAPPHAQ